MKASTIVAASIVSLGCAAIAEEPRESAPASKPKLAVHGYVYNICYDMERPSPGKCRVIEGAGFDVWVWSSKDPTSCVKWKRSFNCLSIHLPVAVAGDATVREADPVDGYCQLCQSQYIDGFVTARYVEMR